MTMPIGEEFIRIRPDASGFRAELQAQIAAALPAVQAQVARAQAAVGRGVAGQAGAARAAAAESARAAQQFVVTGQQGERVIASTRREAEALAKAARGSFAPLTEGSEQFVVTGAQGERVIAATRREAEAFARAAGGSFAPLTEGIAAATAGTERFAVTSQAGERVIAATRREAEAFAQAARGTFEPLTQGVERFVVTGAQGERVIAATRREAESLARAAGGTFAPLTESVSRATTGMERFVITSRAGQQVIESTRREAQAFAQAARGTFEPLAGGAERFIVTGAQGQRVLASTRHEAEAFARAAGGSFAPLTEGIAGSTASMQRFVVTSEAGERVLAATRREAQAFAQAARGTFEPLTSGVQQFVVTGAQGERALVATRRQAEALAAIAGGTFAPFVEGAAGATAGMQRFVITSEAGQQVIEATRREAQAFAQAARGTFEPLVGGAERFIVTGAQGERVLASTRREAEAFARAAGGSFAPLTESIAGSTAGMQRFVVTSEAGERVLAATRREAQAFARAARGTFEPLTRGVQQFVVTGAQGERALVASRRAAESLAKIAGGTFAPFVEGAAAATTGMERFVITSRAGQQVIEATRREAQAFAQAARGTFAPLSGGIEQFVVTGAQGERVLASTRREAEAFARAARGSFAPLTESIAGSTAGMQRFVVTSQAGERVLAATREEAQAFARAAQGTFQPLTGGLQQFVVTGAQGQRALVATRTEAAALAKVAGGTFTPFVEGAAAATAELRRFVVTGAQGERAIASNRREAEAFARAIGGTFAPLKRGIEGSTAAMEQFAVATRTSQAVLAATRAEAEALRRATGGIVIPVQPPRASGLLLPAGVKDVAPEIERTALVTEQLGQASRRAAVDNSKLTAENRRLRDSASELHRNVETAERDIGRFARGTLAATAASTGFFRAVSFASGAFLVGAGIGATIGAAVDEFTQMTAVGAQTAAIIKATGGAANVTAGQIDALAKRQLELTGTDDELVKTEANVLLTFRKIRNEVGAGNDVFTRAVKDTQDISAVFKTDLRSSAVQLGKALQDPTKGVTALRRSGITLTAGQRDLIKELQASGRILTAQKIILGEVERQVGGTAEAVGRTLVGRLRAMREESQNSLGEFVKRVSESEQATENFDQSMAGVKQTVGDVVTALRPLGEVAKLVGQSLEFVGVQRTVRVVTLAAAAFAGLKLALLAARTAQQAYTSATTIATVATAAEGGAAVATTSRISASAAALRIARGPVGLAVGITAVTLALIKLHDIARRQPGTLEATSRALDDLNASIERNRELTSQLAGRREDVSIANFDVAGAQRAVARAQAALTNTGAAPGSLVAEHLERNLLRAENELTAANRRLAEAQRQRDVVGEQLTQNERARQSVIRQTTKDLRDQIKAFVEGGNRLVEHSVLGIPVGFGFRAAGHDVDDFIKRMQEVAAQGGPIRQRVGGALETVATVLNRIPTQKEIAIAVKLAGGGESINEIVNRLLSGGTQPTLVLPGPQEGLLKPGNIDVTSRKLAQIRNGAAEAVKAFSVSTEQGRVLLPRILNGQLQTTEQAIANFRRTGENLGLFQNAAAAERYAQALRNQQNAYFGAARGAAQLADNEQIRARGLRQVLTPGQAEEQEFLTQKHILTVLQQKAKAVRDTLTSQRAETAAARDSANVAREALRSEQQTLANARQSLADATEQLGNSVVQAQNNIQQAINSSRDATNNAIQSAKSNLDQLGSSLADLLSTAREELGETTKISPEIAARVAALKREALAGGGGPETQRVAQQIQTSINAKTPPTVDTDRIQKALGLLTDNLNRGVIRSLPQFNRRLNQITSGINLRQLGRTDPVLARQIRDTIAAARAQARQIVTSPRRRGSGDQPEVVDIATVIRQGANDIAAARKAAADDIKQAKRAVSDASDSVSEAVHDVGRAQRRLAGALDDLRREQTRETKLNTKWLRLNTQAIQQQNKLFGGGDTKPKPKNRAGREAGDAAAVGASPP